MKNTKKLFGIIAILVLIVFASCGILNDNVGNNDGNDGSNIHHGSYDEVEEVGNSDGNDGSNIAGNENGGNDSAYVNNVYGYFSYEIFNGEITITGYNGTDEVINIPSQINGKPVTVIGNEAFAGDLIFGDLPDEYSERKDREPKEDESTENLPLPRGRITAVTIPDGVKIIENRAFVYNQINEINIPASVTIIGVSAFAHNNLTEVIIPDNVVSIAALAFAFNQLTQVNIPDAVLFIESNVFSNNKITEATIGNGVSYINTSAFASNQLNKITIPNSVYVIGRGAFSSNPLVEIIIGNSVNSIGDYAFIGNKLTQITIPDSVNFIGQGAFNGNKLTEITIGTNVFLASSASGFASDAIGNGFETFYNNSSKKAGTYTRPDTTSATWSRQ